MEGSAGQAGQLEGERDCLHALLTHGDVMIPLSLSWLWAEISDDVSVSHSVMQATNSLSVFALMLRQVHIDAGRKLFICIQ